MERAYEWIDEDMGKCSKHPDMALMFAVKETNQYICLTCMYEQSKE